MAILGKEPVEFNDPTAIALRKRLGIVTPDGIIRGGYVTWMEGLTFRVTMVVFVMADTPYTIEQSTTITLDAADPALPRIDSIIVDTTPQVTILKGTAAANPQKPTPDPTTQLELTYVLIPAGATEPGNVSGEMVYNENIPAEYTHTESGVTVDYDSLVDPLLGLKCALTGELNHGDTITFTRSAPTSLYLYENFTFSIKLLAIALRQHAMTVQLFLAGTPVSKEVTAIFGRNLLTWQTVVITNAEFSSQDIQFDKVVLKWTKAGVLAAHIGIYLDNIRFEEGVTVPPLQVQADWGQQNPNDPSFIKNKPTLADTFLELTDTPDIYTGQAGKVAKVNATEDGLEFGDSAGAYLGIEVLAHHPAELWEGRIWMLSQDPLQGTIAFTNETYFGANDGTITMVGQYGSLSYEFSKDNGATWQANGNYTGLSAGSYICSLRDAGFPLDIIYFGTVVITEPLEITANYTKTNETGTDLNDGTITILNPSGGASSNYEFTIDNTTWQEQGTLVGLAPAAYVLKMREVSAPSHVVTIATITIYEYGAITQYLNTIDQVGAGAGYTTGLGNSFTNFILDFIFTPIGSMVLKQVDLQLTSRDATLHSNANNMDFRICADNAGNPNLGNVLYSLLLTDNPAAVSTPFIKQVPVDNLSLVAGTKYHILISMAAGSTGKTAYQSKCVVGASGTDEIGHGNSANNGTSWTIVLTNNPNMAIYV